MWPECLDEVSGEIERESEVLTDVKPPIAVRVFAMRVANSPSTPGSVDSTVTGALLTSTRSRATAPGRSGRPTPNSAASAGSRLTSARARSRFATRSRACSVAATIGERIRSTYWPRMANDIAAPATHPKIISTPPRPASLPPPTARIQPTTTISDQTSPSTTQARDRARTPAYSGAHAPRPSGSSDTHGHQTAGVASSDTGDNDRPVIGPRRSRNKPTGDLAAGSPNLRAEISSGRTGCRSALRAS